MFEYFPHFLPTSIVVIGAGGTGSRLMSPLVQLVRTCLRKHNLAALLDKCDVYVIDGDVVEDKNLLRQNFIPQDVGRNKAVVVAERYARAFGVNVVPIDKFLTPITAEYFDGPSGQLSFRQVFENSIVVFAVDSAKARREILTFMNRYCNENLFVVDAGNEDDFGQIKLFTGHFLYSEYSSEPTLEGLPKQIPSRIQTSFIPMDFEYYRNLGESAAERSCEALPQTLAINTMMATLILSAIQNFMQLRPIAYDGQTFSLKGGVGTNWNTPFSWSRRIVDVSKPALKAEVARFLDGNKNAWVKAGWATSRGVGGAEGQDIFYRLRLECIKDLKEAGLLLKPNGETEAIAPPPAPVLEKKAPAVPVPKKSPPRPLGEELVDDFDEVPAAPPLAARPTEPVPAAPVLVTRA